jgi:hypothetical protein
VHKHKERGGDGEANDHGPRGGDHAAHTLSEALSLEVRGTESHYYACGMVLLGLPVFFCSRARTQRKVDLHKLVCRIYVTFLCNRKFTE